MNYQQLIDLTQYNDQLEILIDRQERKMVRVEEDIARMCKRIVRLKDGVIVEDKKITQKKAL